MILCKADRGMFQEAAAGMSTSDRAEMNAWIPGRDPLEVLLQGLDGNAKAIVHNGKILAVGGTTGCLWFVTTVWVDSLSAKERDDMLFVLWDYLEECRKVLPIENLTNYVHVDNLKHIRLLTILGAGFADEPILSPGGRQFIQFFL